MSAQERWGHATAAYSLMSRSMEANATGAAWALSLAATNVRQAGDPDLADQIEELAEGWCPADSDIRATMDRVAELAARLEQETLK
jgi:hypothetical protein